MEEAVAVEVIEAPNEAGLPAPVALPAEAVADGSVPAVQGDGVGALAARWLQFLDVSPKTVETYTKAIRSWLRWLRERGIASPCRADVLAYRDWLRENHAPATVSLYMAALRTFSGWLEQEGLQPDIARRIKGAKLDREHKKDYLTSAQAGRLLECVDRSSLRGLRDYAMLALMLTTGLRTISVVRANVEDLGTAGGAVVLRYQSKGHDERGTFVKLAPQTDAAVRAYLAARGQAKPEEPLFASVSHRNNGGRLTTASLSRMVKRRLVAVGLASPRLTAHSLRHTAATLNLLGGGSVEETRQLLGHASLNTTMIYAHELDRVASKSEGRIADQIFGTE